MKTLDEIMLGVRSDKASLYHNYTPVYEHYFKPFRHEEIVLLELGIGDINSLNREGESLKGLRIYFYNGDCYAIDNNEVNVSRTPYSYLCDQTDKKRLEEIVFQIGNPDIIIDDASHQIDNTITSFEILFPLLKPKGLYCIEDTVAPAYWPSWGGQVGIFDSKFMNYFFNFCHCINLERQHNFPNPPNVKIPDWISEIDSIHFHHSQIIIKKK